jgi:hypothetical protein
LTHFSHDVMQEMSNFKKGDLVPAPFPTSSTTPTLS